MRRALSGPVSTSVIERALAARAGSPIALERWGFGKKIANTLIDDALIPDEAREFVELPSAQMILAGPIGCGKTTTAAWCVGHIGFQHGEDWNSAICVKATALYRACFEKEWALWKRCRSVHVLVIDDFGNQHDSDWPRGELTALIDDRWENGRKTLITTRHSPHRIIQGPMPDAWSRLTGAPGPGLVTIKRGDMRK